MRTKQTKIDAHASLIASDKKYIEIPKQYRRTNQVIFIVLVFKSKPKMFRSNRKE